MPVLRSVLLDFIAKTINLKIPLFLQSVFVQYWLWETAGIT